MFSTAVAVRALTLAIAPAGSTCSLAASLGIRNAHAAALVMIKGGRQPLDIGRVTVTGKDGSEYVYHCTTVAAWGFISHILQVGGGVSGREK